MDIRTTTDWPSDNRLSAWHELYAARVEPTAFIPACTDRFGASLASGDLGPLRIVRLSCGDVTLERPSSKAAEALPFHTFILVKRGVGTFAGHGRTVRLEPGDLLLTDGLAPSRLTLAGDCELLMLRVSADLLKEHLPSPECFCGRPLSAGEGLTSTATAMMTSLFGQLEAGLALHYQDRVSRHLLDMLATAYAIACEGLTPGSSVASGRHATVKLYIEQHLRDPDLSPRSIAERLKLSSRYVRMLFAAGKETVSAYILRRRLEECARQIADPSWRGHSMTEIAFAWGFKSAPHFTRSFRARYAMSPRDYRRLKLAGENNVFRRGGREQDRPALAAQAA